MENKLTKAQFVHLATSVIGAIALLLVAFGVLTPDAAAPADEATARGTTNMDTLVLSEDLTVTDDLDIGGDVNFGSSNLVPVAATSGLEAYFATATFTGTKVITTSAHGLTAVTAAVCTLGETPATGSGDGALCWVGISGTTVTFTVEQDDWTTNAANSTKVYYAVVGTP